MQDLGSCWLQTGVQAISNELPKQAPSFSLHSVQVHVLFVPPINAPTYAYN